MFFTLIVAYVSGTVATPGALLIRFVAIVGGGALMGAALGMPRRNSRNAPLSPR